ncbi:hypothetical protein LUZ61_015781 [Rhynchospora tenuis]|uniref:Reverse transcriptase domain-containing protein n=1 Tax=Rhynchospora tenuis TaxID=198213 RepID=A0AAD5Z4A4_9POAL|nr:hypothetical protein LUZ61_015781 [Rhynchospora tenuis]
MVEASSTSIPHNLIPKLHTPFFLLQYADDTLIFATARGQAIKTLLLVLKAFSQVSGLRLNWNKTSFVPFNLNDNAISSIESLLSCSKSSLPLTYLGLPLTASRPSRLCFQQLIDKIRGRLMGWQSNFLSKAGRTVLTTSVLSSIPVFFMSVFTLPKWVIKEIDRIRRNFIWKGNSGGGNGIHLVAWDRLCLPKSVGGLGLIDLGSQNVSLLLRWLWRLHTCPDSQWTSLIKQLYGKRSTALPMFWNQSGSFFWRDLMSLRLYFQLSTTHEIRDGATTSFWFQRWERSHLSYFGNNLQKHPLMNRRNVHMTVQDAVKRPHSFLQSPFTADVCTFVSKAQNLILNQGTDEIQWRWSSDGQFSVSSTYKGLILPGKTSFKYSNLWKLKIPPSLKHFLYYMSLGRILTQDQLLKRGIQVNAHCYMCSQDCLEDANHLFCDCVLARDVWLSLQIPPMVTADLASICGALHSQFSGLSTFNKVTICSALWSIWKERNCRIFRNKRRNCQALHDWIVQEATLFMKWC